MKLNRESLEELDLTPEIKADISELFSSIEEKENSLAELQSRVPTDSQKIVDNIDYEKFTRAQTELTELKEKLAEKLEEPPIDKIKEEQPEAFLSAFHSFFES